MAVRIVKQYENGVLFRLGGVGDANPGLRLSSCVDVLTGSLRIVTLPIQSQGIITRDNVSVDVSAVAYFKVVDAVKSVVAIENVCTAIDEIAQTTLRKVVGQHTLDETLSETDKIDLDIQRSWTSPPSNGACRSPWSNSRTSSCPNHETGDGPPGRGGAGETRENHYRRGRIAGRGRAGRRLGHHDGPPLALQLRNLQTLVELGVDKNTTVVFPAPLMSTIAELGTFLARESGAAAQPEPQPQPPIPIPAAAAAVANGSSTPASRP